MDFLPVNKQDMRDRGIDRLDFVFVIGDAYVDHPSFGPAIISRILERHGYKVGIISQPNWKEPKSVAVLGEPRLGFLVSGGNMDSMVNHFSVTKHRRTKDAYTPGGDTGKRPDYATVVYGNLIRQTFRTIPVIIGGLEASLRRLAHYDYWSNKVKRSILLDSQADLLIYGMGESAVVEIADALSSGMSVQDICFINGTVYKTKNIESVFEPLLLTSFDIVQKDKKAYAQSFFLQYQNTDPFTAHRLIEPYPNGVYAVQNPPQQPLTTYQMDEIYNLPFTRKSHPSYDALGGVSALDEVRFSLTSSRGCFGGCNFCSLSFHQGRIVQARSHASILEEARLLTQEPDFKGYIHDVGGPTANFRKPSCEKQIKSGTCSHRQCLFPSPCKKLSADHSDYLSLLRKLRALPGVKKVFIRSGIRFDYLLQDKDETFFRELVQHHISGQLRVAPEHISDPVLKYMGKPGNAVYQKFIDKFTHLNQKTGKKQFIVPYLISSHPGSSIHDAIALAEYLRNQKITPEQVQDFYPTPSTLSTCMYYTGYDPRTMERVFVPKSPKEKAMQRALIQFRDPKNEQLVRDALFKAGRGDLIGFGEKCLLRPRKDSPQSSKKPFPRPKKENPENREKHAKKSKTTKQFNGENQFSHLKKDTRINHKKSSTYKKKQK